MELISQAPSEGAGARLPGSLSQTPPTDPAMAGRMVAAAMDALAHGTGL